MRYFLMAIVSVGVFSCTQPAAAQKKVVIIGSSTSACFNLTSTSNCYVNRLNSFYDTQAPFGDTSFNNGLAVGGYTVYRGMPTSYVSPYSDVNFQPDPARNITTALSMHPDVVIVNYPTNGFDVLSVSEVMFCFRTIRDSANIKGVPCFITTAQPRLSPSSFNTSAVKHKLSEIKDSVLLEFGPFALDFYTGMINPPDSNLLPIYNSGDDIHFNDAGHGILAQRVEAANIFSATLPATFLKYNASYNGSSTLVTWSTAKEIDVAHYEIDRSADGISFTEMGELDPNNGSGIYDYQYTDKQPFKGWSYYKVIIVDRDGKKQSSPVFKAFSNAGKLSVSKVITQPSQIILALQSSEAQNAGLQVLNSTGQLLQKSTRHIDNGNSTLIINTTALSSGVYYIKLVTASGEPIITSFIKN